MAKITVGFTWWELKMDSKWISESFRGFWDQKGRIHLHEIFDWDKNFFLEQLAKVLGIHTGSEIADNVLFDIIKSHLSAVLTTCIDETDDEGTGPRTASLIV